MKRYPFIKQDGIKDCGPACLLMIIKYYKGYIPLEELRELTKTTRLGTDAYHLVETAKEIGFNVKAFKTDLNEHILLPAITHVTTNGFDHYMVLYEVNFKKKCVLVGDPAVGIYKMKFEEFEIIWNHIIIELIPNRTIPINHGVSFFSFLISYWKPYLKTLIILLISSILISLLTSISSFYFRQLIDAINFGHFTIISLSFIFLIIYLLKIVMNFIRNNIYIRFQQSLDMNMSCDIFNQLIDLPYQYYHNRTTGEIISRFDDLGKVKQMMQKIIFTLFSDIPFVFVSFIILFCIDFYLSLFIIFILFCYISTSFIMKNLFQKKINKIQEQTAMTTSFITEILTGIETINNCCLKERIREKFADKYYCLLDLENNFSTWVNRRYIVTESIYNIGIIFLLLSATLRVVDGKMTLGNLVMFYSIFISFLEPLKNIIQMDLSFKEAKNALKRMLGIFIPVKDSGVILDMKQFNIIGKDLTFYYQDRDLVLDHINFKIKQGEKVLITGKSGSGKSTLLKMIMKYYETTNNHLFIDNVDINHYKDSTIHNFIGYLSANEWLFTGSILENIDAKDNNQALEMIEFCEVHEVMKKRSLNLHSIIEENGFNLSGGEKQRIALARFLSRDFKILLIDEGLNQMDINLERRILKRIFKKYAKKTIIVVSHRLDNMDLFDHMIEIEKGKIRKDIIKNGKQRVAL